jgi:DNA polymerase IV
MINVTVRGGGPVTASPDFSRRRSGYANLLGPSSLIASLIASQNFHERTPETMTSTSSANPASRRILLVDCDAFFVQVARLADPEGAGKADLLLVGGSRTGRGVVTSASYGARAFGVRSAMPTAQALRLCPDAMVVPVPRELCGQKSRDIKTALLDLSPVVQAASVDEFYLDLSGTERLFHETLEASAWRIREAVLEQTQISVSIGGGTRKMIAKLASGHAKPAGVHIVPEGKELDFMRRLELADIPGVGPALLRALTDRGLVRIDDALRVQEEWLQRWFGDQRGAWLYQRIRGIDRSRVNPGEPRKSISSERTFFADIDNDTDLERYLLRQVGTVGRTLRKSELRARTVTVKIRDMDFTTRSASHTVEPALESDRGIFAVAQVLLRELRKKRRRPSRLLGVGLSNFVDASDSPQLGLFANDHEHEQVRDRTLSHIMDELKEKFGDDAILPGRVMKNPPTEE